MELELKMRPLSGAGVPYLVFEQGRQRFKSVAKIIYRTPGIDGVSMA